MPRTHDDFDDDDFDGYRRPPVREVKRGNRLAVVITAGMLLALLVGGIVMFMLRGKRAEHAAERARTNVLRVEQMRASAGAPVVSESNWPRIVGVWTRTPAESEVEGYPFRFEFSENMRAVTLRATDGGKPFRQESTVEVLSDNNDVIRLRLHVPMGLYGYTFRLRPNGTLTLEDGKSGLVFVREP